MTYSHFTLVIVVGSPNLMLSGNCWYLCNFFVIGSRDSELFVQKFELLEYCRHWGVHWFGKNRGEWCIVHVDWNLIGITCMDYLKCLVNCIWANQPLSMWMKVSMTTVHLSNLVTVLHLSLQNRDTSNCLMWFWQSCVLHEFVIASVYCRHLHENREHLLPVPCPSVVLMTCLAVLVMRKQIWEDHQLNGRLYWLQLWTIVSYKCVDQTVDVDLWGRN